MEPLWPLYLKSDDNDNNAASHDPLETVSDFTTSIMNLYRGVRRCDELAEYRGAKGGSLAQSAY